MCVKTFRPKWSFIKSIPGGVVVGPAEVADVAVVLRNVVDGDAGVVHSMVVDGGQFGTKLKGI
jgi:hypothetical protein